MQPLISMSDIDKSFSGVVALNSAKLEINPGEIHGLIGQNGAGKSTLIKLLTGIYRRDAGVIKFAGRAVTFSNPREALKAGIATIYQELNLVALRSVTENVMMGYEPKHFGIFIDWAAAHRQTRKTLLKFGIEIDVKAPLGSYSPAIQQLVAIVRAVSQQAKLVIMDEPTSSLDANEVDILFGVARSLKEAGVSVLYVSHFLDELFSVCDRVTIMRDGKTVGRRNMADSTKLDLIADMLGRDSEEIKSAGMTQFHAGTVMAKEPLLSARGIATRSHLHNFDLNVNKGEIVGIGGLLGSGRTEAARAIFGVDRLHKGEILFKNKPFAPRKPAEAIIAGIGFLTEDRKSEGIIPEMSVRENVTLALLPKLIRYGQIDHKRERQLVEGYIKALDIKTANMDQPIRELSGGNQQKTLLARWLAIQPELLILDEPTRGVDVGAKLEIQMIIKDYVARGFTVLLISSEFEELVEGADRIVILQDGHSVSELQNPGITENALVGAIANYPQKETSL